MFLKFIVVVAFFRLCDLKMESEKIELKPEMRYLKHKTMKSLHTLSNSRKNRMY